MSIPAVNQLANMEYMLYGGKSGLSMNCPSYINGYAPTNNMMQYANYYNPSFRGYAQNSLYAQNDATRVDNSKYSMQASNTNVDWSNPQFRGLSDDLNVIGDYYVQNSAPSESFLGAAVGGAAFGLMNNPRLIAHPWNAATATPAVEKMFAEIKKDGTFLNKLWTNKTMEGGYELLSEAYARTHKLESLNKSKLGLFRKRIDETTYNTLKKAMEDALRSGDPKKIALATENIKKATNAFTGYIPQGLRKIGLQGALTKVRKFINPSQYQAASEVAAKNLTEAGVKTSTLGNALKHSCGIGNGLFFAGMELLFDYGKIKKAFAAKDPNDPNKGWRQLGQSLTKGVGSAIGWAVGEGIGAWAGAKIGAAAGTAICPGVGTAIGAVAGLVGGSIGCWLAGKATHKIIGKEAGAVAEVDEMKKTKEGQVQLLQLTAPQALEDKNLNPRTLQAIQNVANFYGVA